MTNARIARAFPQLTEPLARVALLGETLAVARDLKAVQQEIAAAGGNEAQLKAVLSRTGLPEEIEDAEKAAVATVTELLAQASEQDLEEGRDKGLLSPDDYREALTAKRTMSLARGRGAEKDRERQ